MRNKLILRPRDDQPYYPRLTAAEAARISLELMRRAEDACLVQAKPAFGGIQGYSLADIDELARIRRLREDLGLDMRAVEVVLRMRWRTLELMAQLEEMERQMRRREQRLQQELQQLRRRLAEEADYQ